jgi:hypothetical protein
MQRWVSGLSRACVYKDFTAADNCYAIHTGQRSWISLRLAAITTKSRFFINVKHNQKHSAGNSFAIRSDGFYCGSGDSKRITSGLGEQFLGRKVFSAQDKRLRGPE